MTDALSGADRLLIFARAPVMGRVKTRLADVIGPEAALRAHVELVTGTLERMAALGDRVELWISDADEQDPQVCSWQQRFGIRVYPQSGSDLGERMCRALDTLLARGSRPVLIGCDCPDIDPGYVTQAFAALDQHDVVLGPAEDGGYGLVGVSRSLPELFRDVPWGSADVLATSIERLESTAVSWALLDPVYDVDDYTDWQRYRQSRHH